MNDKLCTQKRKEFFSIKKFKQSRNDINLDKDYIDRPYNTLFVNKPRQLVFTLKNVRRLDEKNRKETGIQ